MKPKLTNGAALSAFEFERELKGASIADLGELHYDTVYQLLKKRGVTVISLEQYQLESASMSGAELTKFGDRIRGEAHRKLYDTLHPEPHMGPDVLVACAEISGLTREPQETLDRALRDLHLRLTLYLGERVSDYGESA